MMAAGGAAASSEGRTLLSQLKGQHTRDISDFLVLPDVGGVKGENSIITASEDGELLIWLRRENGEYWPSVHKTLSAPGCSLALLRDNGQRDHAGDMLFVGLTTGVIVVYAISEDWNGLVLRKTFSPHSGRVVSLCFGSDGSYLVSTGRDNNVVLTSLETWSVSDTHKLPSVPSALTTAPEAKTMFVGDTAGRVHILKVEDNKKFKQIMVLEGHRSAVRALHWEPTNDYLYSGGDDKIVVAWAIGACKGERFELRGHRLPIQHIMFHKGSNKLFTADSRNVFVWDMAEGRVPNPVWKMSDTCQLAPCDKPFLWNMKKIWDDKDFMLKRQHHCRKCGIALCDECCHGFVLMTTMGHETRVRVCKGCYPKMTPDDAVRRCTVHEFGDKSHCLKFAQLAAGFGLVRCESTLKNVKMESMAPVKEVDVMLFDVDGLANASGMNVEEHHEKHSVPVVVESWWNRTMSKAKMMMKGESEVQDNPNDQPVYGSSGGPIPYGEGGAAAAQVYKLGGDDDEAAKPDLLSRVQDEGDDDI